jgi:hypothetical protein
VLREGAIYVLGERGHMALEEGRAIEDGETSPRFWRSVLYSQCPSSWEDVSFCHNIKENFTSTLVIRCFL